VAFGAELRGYRFLCRFSIPLRLRSLTPLDRNHIPIVGFNEITTENE
jgi:hypothetical protein